ncbi:MAG: type II toxin-antitoxin system PemK/MazF family toxin [Acidobacteria bacterium]|nr:type II toxin-antitoxin system PemK/MazF family toxin [Acidobacteriota bacterium]
MKRGELYRVEKPSKRDPKGFRVFVIVSRQSFIERTYPSVICAPIYSNCNGLSSEVEVGIDEGLKRDSCIRCDELVSLQKFALTNFVGSLSPQKIQELNQALKVALEIE